MATELKVIDGDGHLFERDEELYPYLMPKYPEDSLRNAALFPSLDGSRRAAHPGRVGMKFDPEGWVQFLDRLDIEEAVLYPTSALGFAFAVGDPVNGSEWVSDLAAAYNNMVSDRFLKFNPRLKAVALLPVQDPKAAAKELHRAVTELGMVGGMLPAPGLPVPYGDACFNPLYEEAQNLDIPLAVHGAAQNGLAIDSVNGFMARKVLAHAYAQITNFTSMIFEQVFDRFPRLKVVYQEAGCGWVPFLIERIDRHTERTGRKLASEQVRNHPVYFHAELDEDVLSYCVEAIGEDRFVYASDFPHESVPEVEETLEGFKAREDLKAATKQKIVYDNIKALYSMK